MHRKVAATLVAVLAFGIASCGGSEETLTRAELVRRVELACRQGQQEAQKAARAARGDDGGAFFEGLLAGQKAVMDRIDDFTASGAAKADFEALKDGIQVRLDAIEDVVAADRADRERAIRSVQADVEAASRRAAAAARRLGVDGCF